MSGERQGLEDGPGFGEDLAQGLLDDFDKKPRSNRSASSSLNVSLVTLSLTSSIP